MSKIIFISFLLINICLSQIGEVIPEKQLRSLKPKKAEAPPKVEDKKQVFKLFQTLYSDSFSNNYYYATLYIGPKQIKQTYIIDTGTATMSSPCAPCDECGKHKTNYYEDLEKKANKPLKCSSKICKMVPASECNVKEKYKDKKTCSFYNQKPNGDGLRGYYLSNIVYFEEGQNQTTTDKKKVYRSYALPLGCTVGEYGKYKEIKSDGVIGLNNEETSFISLLYKLKIINKNIFSLCLGLEGGYMSLGEVDTTYHSSKKINYIPLLNSSALYLINLKGIILGNNKKSSTVKMTAYIDTGSTFTILPKNCYKAIIKEFDDLCTTKKGRNRCGKFVNNEELGYCADFDDRESLFKAVSQYWPNITLEFDNNIKYTWTPINYYYYYIKGHTRKACLGFKSHRSNITILGVNFMHGNDIIFDREKKLLGFVPSDCSRKNIMWNRMKGILPSPTSKVKSNPALVDKEIHKNEKKFNLGDNIKKGEVKFIEGKNKELDFNDFKLINYIILLISILLVVIVLLIVIIVLMFNKKEYSKLQNLSEESGQLNTPNNVMEEVNDTKVIQEEVQFLKKMMKNGNK